MNDLEIKGINDQTVLFIHDIFHRINPAEKKYSHLISYLIAMVRSLSRRINFPIFLTNEGRAFENTIHPLHETIMLRYLDDHLLFEKSQNKICISRFSSSRYEFFTELILTSKGLDLFIS